MTITKSPGRQSAFTIIELFLVIIITGIVASFAVPAFKGYVLSGQLEKATNDIVTTLNFARSEAMKRNNWVTVCKSSDGATCDASSVWKDGWIAFDDTNNNGALNAGEQLLRVYPAIVPGFTLNQSGNFDNWLAFQPTGANQGSSASGDIFKLCYGTDIKLSRSVEVKMSGSVRQSEQAASCP